MANLSVLQHSSELEHVRPVKPSCTAQVRISVWDSQTVTESHTITSWFGLEGTFEDYLLYAKMLYMHYKQRKSLHNHFESHLQKCLSDLGIVVMWGILTTFEDL